MATILAALRFAVNVEDHLYHLQTQRFRHSGDTSARLLPPLVPIAGLPRMPAESALDAFRKRHVLEIAGNPEGATDPGAPASHPPPAAYTLEITGYREMVADLVHRFGPPLPPEGTPEGPPELRPSRDAPPLLRLGWTDAVATVAPPGMPHTRALWLCVFSVAPGSEKRWWNGCSWELVYVRRFSTRQRPEPPAAQA